MAAKRANYKLACVNLDEADRMVVVSAINSSSTSLSFDLDWALPDDADIHIVDVTHPQDADFPVTLRYSTRKNGIPVDLYRPIRARSIIEALERASVEAARQPARQTPTRRYRGAVVQTPTKAASGAPMERKTPRGVTYRGVKVGA